MSQDDWKISLGTRNNLLFNDTPYIPILVEDIRTFVSFEDHEENGVKTIQTLGELIPKSERNATLLSLTPGNNSQFPISLKNLDVNDIYIKNSNEAYCPIWENHVTFKVYGTLKKEKAEFILETTHLVPVHDVKGTWNLMTQLISIARSEYRHYYRTRGQNDMLQLQWNKMKEDKKRLVNEKVNNVH